MTLRAMRTAAALAAGVAAFAAAPAVAADETRTVFTTADAGVRADRPSDRSGTATALTVRARPSARAYLRFEIPELRGPVKRALLRVGVSAPRSTRLEVRPVSAGWSESRLNWRSAPAPGAVSARSARFRGAGVVVIDVTALVRRAGVTAVTVGAADGAARISTREHDGGSARIVVTSAEADPQPEGPLRVALYETRYPEAWTGSGPSAGRYSLDRAPTRLAQVRGLEKGRIAVAAGRWDGRGSRTERRLRALLGTTLADGAPLWWAAAPGSEESGAPSTARIAADLARIDVHLGRHPRYLREAGRPVVVVRLGARDTCSAVRRWVRGNRSVGAHLVVVAPGARGCRPSGGTLVRLPARGALRASTADAQSVAPGPRGNPAAFREAVRAMIRSGARWQVVDSFNDWARGTAVEAGADWRSPSGAGAYLDALEDPWLATVPEGRDPVVAAAADIACAPTSSGFNDGAGTASQCRQRATSDLLVARDHDAVLVPGDLQYEKGEAAAFAASYHPSWGRVRDRTRPVPGNHEYGVRAAADYFDYFNGPGMNDGPAGPRGRGWYAFDLGPWRLISLNSSCEAAGGCEDGSPQHEWLERELRLRGRPCTVAQLHHPLYTSGKHGPREEVRPLIRALHAGGVDVLLTGHEHDYERFAPQNAAGAFDPAGMRAFVVGMGGKDRRGFLTPAPNSEVRESETFGVLELRLRPTGYDWTFLPEAGATFSDSGSGACH